MSVLEVFNNPKVSASSVQFTEVDGCLIFKAKVKVTVGEGAGPAASMDWMTNTGTGESVRRVQMSDYNTDDHRFTRWLVELSITMDMVWEALEEMFVESQLMRTNHSLEEVNQWAKKATYDWDVFD